MAGDPAIDFTETHQVVVNVGYAQGPEIAGKLETNNIICNYQAAPDEEGFTASGALRLGVSEMTRFGMREEAFRSLGELINDVVSYGADVKDQVRKMRKDFQELRFCFSREEYADVMKKLHDLL